MAIEGLQDVVALYEDKSHKFMRSLPNALKGGGDFAHFFDELREMQAVDISCRPAIAMRNRFAQDLIKDFT